MKLLRNRALVVFSGGQDSTTCLGWALRNFEDVFCLSFDYGQKHAIELAAARQVVSFFETKTGRTIPHELITLSAGVFAGMSPLTNKDEQLETYKDHDEMEGVIGDRVEKTFVPMRNAVFLMLAANRAAVLGCSQIVTGVCQADNANYPDCRQTFVDSAEETINEALGLYGPSGDDSMDILIQTPLMNMSKAESIKLALRTPHTYAALAYSHTAYDGQYPPNGKDHASILRAHGFEEADMPDPLVVRAWGESHMDLPTSANYDQIRAMGKSACHDWLFRHPAPAPL